MILNFLNENKNDFQKTRDDIILYEQWVAYCRDTRLSAKCLEMLKAGVIYIEGRDEMKQPVIVINPSRIDFSIHKKAEVYMIICRCLIIVKEYMMHDGFVEKWRIIIDGEYQMNIQINYGVNKYLFIFIQLYYFIIILEKRILLLFLQLNISKIIQFILFLIEKFKQYFPNHLDNIYLIRFNKYLTHENKQILQLLFPGSSKSKILFIFEEEEYKSKIIKSMGQTQLEMKFGGLKMNYKQYWRIVDDGNLMDDQDMIRHFQILEESLEKLIIQYTIKFIDILKSMTPQSQYILILITIINQELIILKNKYKTPEELEAEEMERERVKRSRKQAEKEQLEREQYELRKMNRKEIFQQQVRFTLPQPPQQQYDGRLDKNYSSVGPEYNVNYRGYDDNEIYRNFKSYEFDQNEYVKKQRQTNEYNYNYFDKTTRYQGMNTQIPIYQKQQHPDSINYQIVQKKYDHDNINQYNSPQQQLNKQNDQRQVKLEQNKPKGQQSQVLDQGNGIKDISQIEGQYNFGEDEKSIQQLNNSHISNIDDPNISKISINSKDKYNMQLHYGQIKGDPNEFISDIKEEQKENNNACSIF